MLARPHLASRLSRQRSSIEEAIALYAALALSVAPRETPQVIPNDPDDDHVIAAALAAQADLVVSGDADLLNLKRYHGIAMVTPAEALRIITPC